tara:strand:- start:55 stop:522 length:468 start_codon:yes stop_codon:yes gene_type:complete
MKILYGKAKEGYKMVGTRFDNPASGRIGALHVSGLLIERGLAKEVPSIYPEWDNESDSWKLDVGDAFTRHCRETGVEYYCFQNTHNNNVTCDLAPPYNEMSCDRVVDEQGQVFYLHLGRGSLKQVGKYYKRNNFKEWEQFVKEGIISSTEEHSEG